MAAQKKHQRIDDSMKPAKNSAKSVGCGSGIPMAPNALPSAAQ
jgi:hypothetical protein